MRLIRCHAQMLSWFDMCLREIRIETTNSFFCRSKTPGSLKRICGKRGRATSVFPFNSLDWIRVEKRNLIEKAPHKERRAHNFDYVPNIPLTQCNPNAVYLLVRTFFYIRNE